MKFKGSGPRAVWRVTIFGENGRPSSTHFAFTAVERAAIVKAHRGLDLDVEELYEGRLIHCARPVSDKRVREQEAEWVKKQKIKPKVGEIWRPAFGNDAEIETATPRRVTYKTVYDNGVYGSLQEATTYYFLHAYKPKPKPKPEGGTT